MHALSPRSVLSTRYLPGMAELRGCAAPAWGAAKANRGRVPASRSRRVSFIFNSLVDQVRELLGLRLAGLSMMYTYIHTTTGLTNSAGCCHGQHPFSMMCSTPYHRFTWNYHGFLASWEQEAVLSDLNPTGDIEKRRSQPQQITRQSPPCNTAWQSPAVDGDYHSRWR